MASKKEALENYVQVKDRVKQFREEHQLEYGIETTMLDHEHGKSCTFRALIRDTNTNAIIATGTAHDKVSDNTHINITSLVENCETSAVGRALAFMGYGIEKSIASREEVNHLQPQVYTGTNKQVGTLKRCLRTCGVKDHEVAKKIQVELKEKQILDDELNITKFIKEYTA